MSTPPEPPGAPLFYERGASWLWTLAGPGCALALLAIQRTGGGGFEPLVPTVFLVLVGGAIAVQVKAARIHASVELTATRLRQGTETLPIAEIVEVYPERRRGAEPQAWESARALSELSSVPRRWTGIGLRLTRRRTVQAWARRHRALRAALTELVADRAAAEPTGAEPLDQDGEQR